MSNNGNFNLLYLWFSNPHISVCDSSAVLFRFWHFFSNATGGLNQEDPWSIATDSLRTILHSTSMRTFQVVWFRLNGIIYLRVDVVIFYNIPGTKGNSNKNQKVKSSVIAVSCGCDSFWSLKLNLRPPFFCHFLYFQSWWITAQRVKVLYYLTSILIVFVSPHIS